MKIARIIIVGIIILSLFAEAGYMIYANEPNYGWLIFFGILLSLFLLDEQ